MQLCSGEKARPSHLAGNRHRALLGSLGKCRRAVCVPLTATPVGRSRRNGDVNRLWKYLNFDDRKNVLTDLELGRSAFKILVTYRQHSATPHTAFLLNFFVDLLSRQYNYIS